MAEASSVLSVFFVGVAAGALGAMVGGGSLLSIPFLIFLGLPPQVAIATDWFAGLGAALTAFFRLWLARKIVWRYVPVLSWFRFSPASSAAAPECSSSIS